MTQPLHEIYAELIRRGMPEHPGLTWTGTGWESLDADSDERSCDIEDARDLLTMHAIRWAYEALPQDGPFIVVRDPSGWLDSVLYATTHMAPKEAQLAKHPAHTEPLPPRSVDETIY